MKFAQSIDSAKSVKFKKISKIYLTNWDILLTLHLSEQNNKRRKRGGEGGNSHGKSCACSV